MAEIVLPMKPTLFDYVKIFGFGLLQVTLVAMNTKQIAQSHFFGAFVIGFSISLVWTFNVRSATKGGMAACLYSLGAACGTVLGMWLAILIYGQ